MEQQPYRQLSRVRPQQEQPEQQEQQQRVSPRPTLPAYGQNVGYLRMLNAYYGQERRLLPPDHMGKYKRASAVPVANAKVQPARNYTMLIKAIVMKPDLYTEVALTQDIPAEKLKKGDVVVVVDYIPHPAGGEEGAILEVFNAVGESIMVTTVPVSAIAPLRSDQVLTVRPLETVID